MQTDFVNLIGSFDNDARIMNMNVIYASPIIRNENIGENVISEASTSKQNRILLSEFKPSDANDNVIEQVMNNIIKSFVYIDISNVDSYQLVTEVNSQNDVYVSINSNDSNVDQLLQTLSFSISLGQDPTYGKVVRIHIHSLFVNKKNIDVGSSILSIIKSGLRYIVLTLQLNAGFIELYSVETAVFFYIKNGFVIRDLFYKSDPQSKVYSTDKILHFALHEDNIEIMKKYAEITVDNFLDFIEYLIKNTKYGKYFTAYFEALNNQDDLEESVFQSRFISSLFTTSVIYPFIRDANSVRIQLKQLTF